MNPILIFRHISFEGPGYLGEILEEREIPYEIIPVDEGATVPTEPGNVSGLVFMGGPMSVNENRGWMLDEFRLIRSAHEQKIPVLGHCLGGQLISRALGARVGPNPVREIGWHPVQLVSNDTACDWFQGLPEEFMVFHWHGERFELPDGAVPLLRSEHCDHQAYICDNSLALQCHIEMEADMIPVWSTAYADEIETSTASIQTETQMCTNLDDRIADLHRWADRIYSGWLNRIRL